MNQNKKDDEEFNEEFNGEFDSGVTDDEIQEPSSDESARQEKSAFHIRNLSCIKWI